MHPDIIHNKYYTIYLTLIAKATQRSKVEGYIEKHHILPRSMGGNNAKTNIAVLTAKEHYVAHHLLYKCTQGQSHIKMSFAWYYMLRNRSDTTNDNRYFCAAGYEKSRKAHAIALSKINKGRNVGTKSYRYKHDIFTFYHVPTHTYVKCTQHDLYTNYDISSPEVCRIMKDPKTSCKGFMWCPDENHQPSQHDNSGLNNASADQTKYNFYHSTLGRFYGTRIELDELHPELKMTKQGMCDVIKGRTKSHRGWKILQDLPT